jgi:hypothetical protein
MGLAIEGGMRGGFYVWVEMGYMAECMNRRFGLAYA